MLPGNKKTAAKLTNMCLRPPTNQSIHVTHVFDKVMSRYGSLSPFVCLHDWSVTPKNDKYKMLGAEIAGSPNLSLHDLGPCPHLKKYYRNHPYSSRQLHRSTLAVKFAVITKKTKQNNCNAEIIHIKCNQNQI